MMNDKMSHKPDIYVLWMCLLMGGLGSLAGLAALLRTGKQLSLEAFVLSMLSSGLFAIAIGSMVFYLYGPEHTLLGIALSILAGLGGHSLIDFTLGALKVAIGKRLDIVDEE